MNAQQVFDNVINQLDRFSIDDQVDKFRQCGLVVPAATEDSAVLAEADTIFANKRWNFDRILINGRSHYALFFL